MSAADSLGVRLSSTTPRHPRPRQSSSAPPRRSPPAKRLAQRRDSLQSGVQVQAALSRPAFFERFNRAAGMAPMEYLLAWRVALAKKMLLSNEGNVAEVAERVGYGSASAFSTAFTRFVGSPPSRFVQKQMEVET
jgi:AraC-like DNA-binding protein